MENLRIYDAVRIVPDTAKKLIQAGRLKGMTDINPMWRIKTLTEQFGLCGIGWYIEVLNKSIVDGASGEKVVFVDIALYIKDVNGWSKPIFGTGGSMLIANERNGLHTSDEAFKMAYTDAISVACKALGVGADVYWEKDTTKYSTHKDDGPKPRNNPPKPGYYNAPETKTPVLCEKCGKPIPDYWDGKNWISANDIKAKFEGLCPWCAKKRQGGSLTWDLA